MSMHGIPILLICVVIFSGCSSNRIPSQSCSLAIDSFPQPLPPVAGADPSRRDAASIRVPTAIRAFREANKSRLTPGMVTWGFALHDFESAHLTVGYKMITGINVELLLRRDGVNGGTYGSGSYRGTRLPRTVAAPPPLGVPTNETPSECRVTIFETDLPPGYHVEPQNGKYYRVLWTRSFEVALEGAHAVQP